MIRRNEKSAKKIKRILAAMLLLSMLLALFGGCGKKDASDVGEAEQEQEAGNTEGDQEAEGDGQGGNKTQASGDAAMGRYMETVSDLSEFASYNNSLYRLADGRLIITDKYKDFISSEDNGETWKPYLSSWRTSMIQNENYVMDYAIGRDGTVAVICDVDEETEETDTGEDDAEREDAEGDAAGDEEAADDDYTLHTKLFIYKPDGTEIPVKMEFPEDYLVGVWMSDDGRIFVNTHGNIIYEVKEDGSSKEFLTVDSGYPNLVSFVGERMILDGYNYDTPLIYDMEKGEYIEDPVLDDFIRENYPKRDSNGGSWFDLFFFPGEENVLYLAGKKGLHRHVLEGSAVEQVIDGSLCTLNNPAFGLQGMTMLDNNEFLAFFTDGRLAHYVYDPNVPTVPSERLKAYSLEESYTLRKAINLYQSAHPEVYVEYEIGMGENDSVTREDALKKLNTRIMAGEGPDLMILDGMPVDSYMEKGVLLDLADYLDGLTGERELFPNLVDAFRRDGKIFMIPCEFQIPVVQGEEKYISKIDGLSGIAGTLEKLRADYPGEDLLNICSEYGIMRTITAVCAPSWKNEDGSINSQAISEFLKNAKRAYDAQMDGLAEGEVEAYRQRNEEWRSYYSYTWEESPYFVNGLDEIGYIEGSKKLDFGTVDYAYGYAFATSLERRDDLAGTRIDFLNGQGGKVFVAKTLAGISASTPYTDKALELLDVLIGKESVTSNFPVNKAAFEETLLPDPEFYESDDVPYSSISSSNKDGMMVEVDIYWMNEEQKERLRGWIASADTAYVSDSVLEDAVYEKGAAYIRGEQSLEDAVSEIEKKMAIYMAE